MKVFAVLMSISIIFGTGQIFANQTEQVFEGPQPQRVTSTVQTKHVNKTLQGSASPSQQLTTLLPQGSDTETSGNNAHLSTELEVFGIGGAIGLGGLLSGDYNQNGVNDLVMFNTRTIVFAEFEDGKLTLQKQLDFKFGAHYMQYFQDRKTGGHFAFFQANFQLQKIDLVSRQVIASVPIEIPQYPSYHIIKATPNQPALLLARTARNQVSIYDPATLKLLGIQSTSSFGILAVGSFTEKNSQQVLFENGEIFNITNNELSYVKSINLKTDGYANIADINNDGLDEVLIGSGYEIHLYTPINNQTLWSKKSIHPITTMVLGDANGDGIIDGLYGETNYGYVYAFDLKTGNNFWQLKYPAATVTNILVADLDKDNKQDIGVSTGDAGWGGEYFHIFDIQSKQQKWRNENIRFPIEAVALSDINQDGELDTLAASTDSDNGYGPALLMAYDNKSKKRIWQLEVAPENWGRSIGLKVDDLDNDGSNELIIGAAQTEPSMVKVLSASDGAEKFKVFLSTNGKVSSLITADLDNDDFAEIIVGSRSLVKEPAESVITILDGISGRIKQQSPSLGESFSGVLDLTPVRVKSNQTVIFALSNYDLYKYQFSDNSIQKLTNDARYHHLTSVLVNGERQLVAANNSGQLMILQLDGTAIATSPELCPKDSYGHLTWIAGLATAGPDRVLYSCGRSIGEYNLKTQSINYSHETGFTSSGDPVITTFNNQNNIVVGGMKVVKYLGKPTIPLPSPSTQQFSTHILKTLEGTLNIDTEVDYFVMDTSTKGGLFKFTDPKTGKFSYQPAGKQLTESLKFYAVKAGVASPSAALTLTLTNKAPVATDLNSNTHWNRAIQLTLPAEDEDQETITFELKSNIQHGKLTMLDDKKGLFEYVPSGDKLGTISFNYIAKDSVATSESKNVIITLTNTTPLASSAGYTTSFNQKLNGTLKGEDIDKDEIRFEIINQPSVGSLTLNSNTGAFEYTPAGENDQQVSFSYVVKDKFATSTAHTVTVNVIGAAKKSGGSMDFIFIAVVLLLWRHRQFLQMDYKSSFLNK